jgi:hypothetical protein
MRRDSKWDVGKMETEGDIAGLIDALKDEDHTVRRNAEKALGNIGGDRAIISLIENMFTNPGAISSVDSLRKLLPETTLSEEIFGTAIKAAKYPKSSYFEQRLPGFLEDLNEAIKKLCSIYHPVSTNLLILISQKRDISLTYSICSGYQEQEVSLDFSKQREMAMAELTRRNSPSYDSSAFLKSSWDNYGE